MRALLKVMIPLALFFGAMLLTLRLTGLLDTQRIEGWIEFARSASPLWAAAVVIALLFADLFIAVPTLTVLLSAGFLLGFEVAALSGFLGLLSAALAGYGLSRRFGQRLVRLVIRDENEVRDMHDVFDRHGVVMILLARAVPMMPELTACLAGLTGMSLRRFMLAWLGSTVPYVLIATYAGSVSSMDNPMPAILTAAGLLGGFSLCWLAFQRKLAREAKVARAEAALAEQAGV